MDIQMPGMDGYDATRAIRAAEPDGVHVPIVAMTASAVEGERERCLDAGMDDFLTKPVDPGRLATTLELWVAGGPDGTTLVTRLDLDRLEELRELDDRARRERVPVPGHLQLPGRGRGGARRAAVDASAGEMGETRTVAHRMAGSALNVGAIAVGGALRAIEQMIDAGDVEAAVALLPAVEDLLREDVEALKAYRLHRYGVAKD